MNRNPIVVVAVLLSVTACVVAGVALSTKTGAPAASAALPETTALQLHQLAGRIEKLEAALAQLEADHHEAPAVAPRPVPERSADPTPELARRLDELDAQIATLQRQVNDPIAEQALAAKKLAEAKPAALKDAQRVAMDPNAKEKDRLAAFGKLRGEQVDGQDARSHDVIVAMLAIAERSDNEESRLDFYRNLHGAEDPAAKETMLHALAQDASSKVREKVAQDMDTYLSDPLVQNALRDAAERDADLGVRARAAQTLAGKRGR